MRVRIEESGRSRIVELTGERVVAGRGSACTLVLEDAAASREHFALEQREGAWWLRDLGSRNGTTVNGRAVPECALRAGDRIGVGSATLVLLGEVRGDAAIDPVAADLAALARDEATGLWTAGWLGRQLDRAVASGRTRAVLVKLDVDSLGLLNDMVGWRKGDEAIVAIAREVRATFEDAFGERCVVAREAGGKLSVLVLDEAPERALEVTELARERASAIALDHVLVETDITLSAGLASAPDDAALGRDLVRCSEAALAEAKRRGRDRTVRAERTIGDAGSRSGSLAARTSGVLALVPTTGADLGPLVITQRGQRTLSLVAAALASDLDLGALLELLLSIALEETDARRGLVVIAEAGELVLAAAADRKVPGARATGAVLSHGIVRAVFESRDALLLEDAAHDPRFRRRPSVLAAGIKSVLAAPIVRGDEVLGVLYLEQDDPTRTFDREARDLLRAFGRLVAGPVRRAWVQRRTDDDLARSRTVIARSSAGDARRRARFAEILGKSAAMDRLFKMLELVAAQPHPVLVGGESGSGKELIARAIHAHSNRAGGPFIAESCAALPESLLEVALFGCKKGAYTGADRDRVGLFEAAHGGTLFLDEVGEMSPALQAKLLRVLEEKKVRRVGDDAPRSVDVRVVAATHRDLDAMADEGTFRRDLFYRLAVLRIVAPPLRERRDDIPLLIDHFVAKAAEQSRCAPVAISPEALARLVAYAWPGNVRQLENEIRKLVALGQDPVFVHHLSPEIAGSAPGSVAPEARGGGTGEIAALLVRAIEGGRSLQECVDAATRDVVVRLLESCEGNKSEVARRLGISRPGLRKMLLRFGLEGG